MWDALKAQNCSQFNTSTNERKKPPHNPHKTTDLNNVFFEHIQPKQNKNNLFPEQGHRSEQIYTANPPFTQTTYVINLEKVTKSNIQTVKCRAKSNRPTGFGRGVGHQPRGKGGFICHWRPINRHWAWQTEPALLRAVLSHDRPFLMLLPWHATV